MNPLETLGKMLFGTLGLVLNGLGKALSGTGEKLKEGADVVVSVMRWAFSEENYEKAMALLKTYQDRLADAELAIALNRKLLDGAMSAERQSKIVREIKRLRKQAADFEAKIREFEVWLPLCRAALNVIDPDKDGKLG